MSQQKPFVEPIIAEKEANLVDSSATSESGKQDEETAVSPPPLRMDGGRDAWLNLFGAFLLFFNTWGLANSFGVFQTYYSNFLLPGTNSSDIAWIGSIETFLTMVTGVFAGWLFDTGKLKWIMGVGIFLEVLGMFMTSLVSKYWHILLAQGICVGLGSGLLALTSLAIIPQYFVKRRLLAGGIISIGSGLSGTLFPIMMRRLIVDIGFGWAVRVLAFLMLGTLLIAFSVVKQRKELVKTDASAIKIPLFRLKWFKDPVYMTFVIAFTFTVAGLYQICFFIEDYALALGVDEDMAFYVLAILNAATTVFRVIPNYLADRYGAMNILVPNCLATALVLYSCSAVHNLAGLIAIGCGYGLATGGLVSLAPLAIGSLSKVPEERGRRIGLGYTIAAFGGLVGTPIAGATKLAYADPAEGYIGVEKQFRGIWYVAAACLTIAAILVVATRTMVVGRKLKIKV